MTDQITAALAANARDTDATTLNEWLGHENEQVRAAATAELERRRAAVAVFTGPDFGPSDEDEDAAIYAAADAMAVEMGLTPASIRPADDAVGHKAMVILDEQEYLTVTFVASEDIDDAEPGLIGWTLWDMAHDLDFGGVFGTSKPEDVVRDVRAAMTAHDLDTYATDYDEHHFDDESEYAVGGPR